MSVPSRRGHTQTKHPDILRGGNESSLESFHTGADNSRGDTGNGHDGGSAVCVEAADKLTEVLRIESQGEGPRSDLGG